MRKMLSIVLRDESDAAADEYGEIAVGINHRNIEGVTIACFVRVSVNGTEVRSTMKKTTRIRHEERRKTARTRILKSARLIHDRECSPIDCIVCNISVDGACLNVANSTCLPRGLEFSFDSFRSVRFGFVIWQMGNRVGLRFCQGFADRTRLAPGRG